MSLTTALVLVLIAAFPAGAQDSQELLDLNLDMQEYSSVAGQFSDPSEKIFISDMAIQNISKQWSIWFQIPQTQKNQEINDLLASSYVHFIMLQYKLNNPTWVRWAIDQLRTSFEGYLAKADTVSGHTYSEELESLEETWLYTFSECTFWNEVIPLKNLKSVSLEFEKTDAYALSTETNYQLSLAAYYLNRTLRHSKPVNFTVCLPAGEYKLRDDTGNVFEKKFLAIAKSEDREGRHLYLTPPLSFKFTPIAKVFVQADSSSYIDTLTNLEFQLERFQEGVVTDFNKVEFGRYVFKVNPPYQLMDDKKKLIIPREEFGVDYLKQPSWLFDKDSYDVITIQSGEDYIYPKIKATVKTRPEAGHGHSAVASETSPSSVASK